MVGMAPDQGYSTVQLFRQQHARKAMRQRQGGQCQNFVCGIFDRSIQSIRAANDKRRIGPVSHPSDNGIGELRSSPLLAAFIHGHHAAPGRQRQLDTDGLRAQYLRNTFTLAALLRLDLEQFNASLAPHPPGVFFKPGHDPLRHLVTDRANKKLHPGIRSNPPRRCPGQAHDPLRRFGIA